MGKTVCYKCNSENCSFVEGVFQCFNCNTKKAWHEVLNKMGYCLSQKDKKSEKYEFIVGSVSGEITYLSFYAATKEPVFYIHFSQPSKLKELILRLKLFFGTGVSILQTGVDVENVRCPVCSMNYTEIGQNEIMIGCKNNLHLSFQTPNLFYASMLAKKFAEEMPQLGQDYITFHKVTSTSVNKRGKYFLSKWETVTTEHVHNGTVEFQVGPTNPRDLAINVSRSILESDELNGAFSIIKDNLFPGIRVVVVN